MRPSSTLLRNVRRDLFGSVVDSSKLDRLLSPHAPVAQWIERLPPEQEVEGSSPFGRTISFGSILLFAAARLLSCDRPCLPRDAVHAAAALSLLRAPVAQWILSPLPALRAAQACLLRQEVEGSSPFSRTLLMAVPSAQPHPSSPTSKLNKPDVTYPCSSSQALAGSACRQVSSSSRWVVAQSLRYMLMSVW